MQITLPDSSKVKLNGNSRLSFHDWEDNNRRVSIDGEAFFSSLSNHLKLSKIHIYEFKQTFISSIFIICTNRFGFTV